MELFGVPLSEQSREDILTRVRKYLSEPGFHRIATVNPEFLVLGEKNTTFKQSLLSANLCIADGFGIVLVGWLKGKKITRIPGADLLDYILTFAEEPCYKVALVIKESGLSSYEEIKSVLVKKYPNIQFVSEATQAAVVICNFGAPEQELLLESLRNNPGNIRLAIGVGGSFDYLTGKLKRAPKIMRFLGLEWLWRLILQPKRIKRIWNAVIVFPIKALLYSR
jgi:N-acetylglucosaminyldiphosphoundecaprenol N-acetyl-beta-D-mannosaminyltransferase